MQIDGAYVTRCVVLVALSLATAVMFAVSLRGNYLFGYGLGQTPEKRQLFAWANVAADVWKAFGLIAVSVLWRTRHRRAASVASVAWFVCLLFGINSALGIYVQDRAALTGMREAKHASYKDAATELAGVEERLRRLPPHRSIGEVEAATATVLGRAVMSGDRVRGTVAVVSLNCTKIDVRTSDACAEVATLRQEHAVATEAQKLAARASILRAQVVNMREDDASLAPDPVGEFYAWISGGVVSVRDVGFGFPLFFALLIEIVSAFGPITIAAYADASRSASADSHLAPEPAAAGHVSLQPASAGLSASSEGEVVSWIAERAAPTDATDAITLQELHGDYECWCAGWKCRARSIAQFEQELDHVRGLPELAGKIRKFGNRYYGIQLASHSALASIGNERSRGCAR